MQNIIITLCGHCKAVATCMCRNGAAKDSENIRIICGTLVILAAITATTIILWQLISFWKASNKSRREREWKVQDIRREQIAEYRRREMDLLKEKDEILKKLDSYIHDVQKL